MEQTSQSKPFVILDSCIINQDRSCSGGDMKLFVKLSSLNLIEWYIPWIIYKEITSTGFIDGVELISKINNSLAALRRLGQSQIITKKLTDYEREFSEIKNKYADFNIEYWNQLFKKAYATVGVFNKELSQNVVESYFSGGPPYQQPKSRKDIPDSFIFEEIKSLSYNNHIIFISCDNNLIDKSRNIDNVTLFNSLKEFFESKEGKTVLQTYEQIEQYNHGVEFIQLNKDGISQIAQKDIVGDLLVPLNDGFVNAMIPSDNNEGGLAAIPEILDVSILIDEIKYIDGIFYIPILANCIFDVEYLLFKADYPLLEDRVITIIDNDWNKYYYLVSEKFDTSFIYNYTIEKSDIESGHLKLQILDKIEQLTLIPLIKTVQ